MGNTESLARCPFCGVAALPKMRVGQARGFVDWGCGSFLHGPEPYQVVDCKLNVAEARLLVADLLVVDLNEDVGDLKVDLARCRGDLADATKAGTPYARERDYQSALVMRVEELEAEVAAREARCAAYVKAIREVSGALDTGEATDHALKEVLDTALACPDLAASRLLAAGKLAEAVRTADDDLAAWATDEGDTDAEGDYYAAQSMCIKALDAYREAVAAEENPNGQ